MNLNLNLKLGFWVIPDNIKGQLSFEYLYLASKIWEKLSSVIFLYYCKLKLNQA